MRAMSTSTLEALKVCIFYHSVHVTSMARDAQAQRDLYVATRDLFSRHDRLSGDQVERIKKRVEAASLRLETVKSAQKDKWADEADKIIGTIERDQATIGSLLARRVFIRHWWVSVLLILHIPKK